MNENLERNILLSSLAFNLSGIRPIYYKNIPIHLLQKYLPDLPPSILKIYIPDEFIDPLKKIKKNRAESEIERTQNLGGRIISFFDKEYPEILKEIADPPPVLYVFGKTLSNEKKLSIVGPRKPSAYGIDAINYIMEGLSNFNLTIVSGLALGIDAEAHKLALKHSLNTIAVLGTGINIPYPSTNYYLYKKVIESGSLISEFPLDMPGFKQNFPRRNRIIAGISEGTLVVEASEKSGSLITASFARDFGKDLFAVPGSIFNGFSKGTNSLIEEGAKPVTSAEGILNERNYSSLPGRGKILPENISNFCKTNALNRNMLINLLNFLMNPKPIDIIMDFCKEKNYRINKSLLTILEIEGLIAKTTDNFFYKVGCLIDKKSSNCGISGKGKAN
jgi:DNA processing protein